MACILPDGWRELTVTGAAQREIDTLALLYCPAAPPIAADEIEFLDYADTLVKGML